ncbi:hypothetical protein M0R45_034516 [Rubus argutus]|uniref:C2 domain-containing protein n=1 Tax=Rubus argutus TaxID=59490 RepID=A0AAW1VSR3_RUBAR
MPYGTLEVVLVDAKDLHDTAFLTQEKTSTVAQGQGTNPEWNESFLFTVTDDVTELRLKIMDKDTFTADDFVGEATIPLEPVFMEGNLPPTSYSVVNEDKEYHGEITVGLTFTPERTSPRRKTMAAMGGAMVTLGGAMVTPGGRGYGDSGECYGEDTRRGYGHSREGYDDDDSRGGYGDSRGTRGGWKESSRCEEESYGGYKESSYRG